MLKQHVFDFFETTSPKEIAELIGVSPPAVCRWGEVVPYNRAQQFQKLSNGLLKPDMSMYDKDFKIK